MQTNFSQDLAAFAATASAEIIPQEIRDLARRSITSALAAGLAATRDPEARAPLRVLERFSARPEAQVIGKGSPKLDIAKAAHANAMLLNMLDFDDTHAGSILHPTAPVMGALLGACEAWDIATPDAMAAFVIGAEVSCRLADAVSPGHYDRGWHITSTLGIFGATAAIGRLLRLSPEQMLSAFGAAAAQASGTVENLGTMAKSVGVGHSAEAGLMAASFAAEGVAGPTQPLEGPRGFLTLSSPSVQAERLTDGLGERWSFAKNMLKPYPCGVVLNPVLDAALALQAAHADLIPSIRKIEISGYDLLRARTDRPNATAPRELQVCAQHAAAAALLRGRFGPDEVSEAAAKDTDISALRALVAPIIVDDSLGADAAIVSLHLADGRVLREEVSHAKGSLARPLTDADVATKLRAECEKPATADRLLEHLARIWTTAPLGQLARLTV